MRKPLQPPYDGPFKVLKCDEKCFTLQLKDRTDVVSLDCLKPAHLDTSIAPDTSPTDSTPPSVPVTSTTAKTATPRITRSGRQVCWPNRFS